MIILMLASQARNRLKRFCTVKNANLGHYIKSLDSIIVEKKRRLFITRVSLYCEVTPLLEDCANGNNIFNKNKNNI